MILDSGGVILDSSMAFELSGSIAMATTDQWLAKFAGLKVDKARGDPAPHKPLLLLVVLELAEQTPSFGDVLPLTPELAFRFSNLARGRTVLSAPTNPPTVDDLRQDPVVKQALEQAWIDSLPEDAALRHEEGGWIYMSLKTGKLMVRRAQRGQQAELEIGTPPLLPACTIVGTFHTHPNPTADGWDPGPSDTDQAAHDQLGVPGLIRADDGVYTAGPASRRGGLTGGPGYPL